MEREQGWLEFEEITLNIDSDFLERESSTCHVPRCNHAAGSFLETCYNRKLVHTIKIGLFEV